jgi:hypothetical protein
LGKCYIDSILIKEIVFEEPIRLSTQKDLNIYVTKVVKPPIKIDSYIIFTNRSIKVEKGKLILFPVNKDFRTLNLITK